MPASQTRTVTVVAPQMMPPVRSMASPSKVCPAAPVKPSPNARTMPPKAQSSPTIWLVPNRSEGTSQCVPIATTKGEQ